MHLVYAALGDPSVAGYVVRLPGNGVDNFGFPGPSQHRRVASVRQRAVVPAAAYAEPEPVAVHSQTRSQHHIRLDQRICTEARPRRFRDIPPSGPHLVPARKSRPVGFATKHWQAHLPATRHQRVHEPDRVGLTIDAYIRRAHPRLSRKPVKEEAQPFHVLQLHRLWHASATRQRA